MYAILDIGGHQYKISSGETIYTDSLLPVEPEALSSRVTAWHNGRDLVIGNPFVKGISIAVEKLNQLKTKIKVQKFKAKSRYRRAKGVKIIKYGYKITKISENKKEK